MVVLSMKQRRKVSGTIIKWKACLCARGQKYFEFAHNWSTFFTCVMENNKDS
jgi:hypothetical protein